MLAYGALHGGQRLDPTGVARGVRARRHLQRRVRLLPAHRAKNARAAGAGPHRRLHGSGRRHRSAGRRLLWRLLTWRLLLGA